MERPRLTPVDELLKPSRFKELYEHALPVVYGYLLRRCGGRDVAAELAQETFLSAIRALHRGAVVDAPLPWLISIARRRLVDHYRRSEVRSRAQPVRPALEGDSDVTTDAEVVLVTALESLPNDYRLALILRYVDDLTLDDVASHLDRSSAATESLLARARKALAKAYQELNDE